MNFKPEALDQSFVDWAAVESDPVFQQADNGKKMQMFDTWADYSAAYTDKRQKEAPEADLPKYDAALKQQADWVKATRSELAGKYTIEGMLAEEDDTNTILETLKDVDGLKSKGFSDEAIQTARKQAEDFILPQMEAFHNNLDGLAGPGQSLTQDELRQKIWEEPNLGDHLRNIENGLANGFTSVLLGTAQGIGSVGQMVGIPGAKDLADTSRDYKEMFGEQLPLDPRMNWATNAAVSGVGQAPAQLLTAFALPVQVAANFGQMFAEDSDNFFQAEKRDEFERRKAAGILPDETPFSAFEKSLSVEETEQMRAMANWKAVPSSLINTVGETLSEKVALKGVPWAKIPYGKTIQKQIDNLRKASPKMAVGARMFSNTAGAMVSESLTEAGQGITSGLAKAAFYDSAEAKDAFKGIGENMVGGAAGGGVMSIAPSATRAFREQALFEDANAVIDGSSKAITGLKAQRDVAVEQFGEDSAPAKSLQRAINTQENEAHYRLSLVGGAFDETRARLGQASADAKNSYRTQLAKWIKENQVGDFVPEAQIASDERNKLGELQDKTARMREGIRQNGDSTGGSLEAGLAQFERQGAAAIQQEANDRRSKAELALQDFIGTVDQEGEGRAAYARVVVSQMFPEFTFSKDYGDDATVVGVLDAVEQNLISDKTDLTEWLKTPLAQTQAAAPSSQENKAPEPSSTGLMTTGQRLDAFRLAEDNLESADEPTKKEFGRLKEDIQFWSTALNDQNASEQDKAEAMERLPALENALLELATSDNTAGEVSSQSTNPNEQNKAPGQASLQNQTLSEGSGDSEGVGDRPSIPVLDAEGNEVQQTQEDYFEESRGFVRALESGEMTGEQVLQNIETVRQEIESAESLTPEQKQEWFKPFENFDKLIAQRQAEGVAPTEPSTPSEPAPEAVQQVTAQPVPVRINGVSGDVARTETGEFVFKAAEDNTETLLRVKETSIDKAPEELTIDDLESGDGAPLVSEAQKQFSVLPSNEPPKTRTYFRSERPQPIQSEQEQTSITPAPETEATPALDIEAISAGVKANPQQHMRKVGNRKLVSREAAVTILSQLPETLTNKDVADLAKDSGMSSANFRKLAALRGDQNAMGSLLNGNMDAELGLFESQPDEAPAAATEPEVALEETPEWRALDDSSVEDTPEWQSLSDEYDKHSEMVSDLELDADAPRAAAVRVAKKLLAAGAIDQKAADQAIRLANDKGYSREDAVSEAAGSLNSDLQFALEQKQAPLSQSFSETISTKQAALRSEFEARRAPAPAPAAATEPAPTKQTDTETESVLAGQTQADRWVSDAFATLEQEVAKLPKSRSKFSAIRERMSTEEGRAEVQNELGKMFNIVNRGLTVSDPVVREAAIDKIFRGDKKQSGRGITKHVLADLLENLSETGDPFFVNAKKGVARYNAWSSYKNRRKEFLKEQGTRDMTDRAVEDQGDVVEDVSPDDEAPATGDALGDPVSQARIKRDTVRQMGLDAFMSTYDRISQDLGTRLGLNPDAVKEVIGEHFAKSSGTRLSTAGLNWTRPSSAAKQKAVATLKDELPQIQGQLISELKEAMKQAVLEAKEMGLTQSAPVEFTGTLEEILELSVADEIANPDFYDAIREAKEKNSVEPLKPLLEEVGQRGMQSIQVAAGIVLNNGKPITDRRRLTSLTKADMQSVIDSNLLPLRVKQTLQALNELSGQDGLGIVRASKEEGFRRLADLYSEQIGNRAPVEVVFNLALNPSTVAQGLWNPTDNRVHISPFLTREKGLMEATILHEVMHPIWDGKITDFLSGNTSRLTRKELDAVSELQRLFTYAKAEGRKRLDSITDPDERRRAERDFLGTDDLREFLNEALNHKPFQNFLNELKDPESGGKTSLYRKILNAILKLIRGGDVAVDSVLQRSFELSVDLANYTDRQLPISKRNKTQIEHFREVEGRKGRPLTPEEVELEAVSFALRYPQPRIAETRAQADMMASQVLSPGELSNYLNERESVRTSDAYEFVSPNDLEEPLDLQGAVADLRSPRQAQLRDFSNRVHEAFGMQGSTVTDAIGDWADGAEPTTVTEHNDPNLSYEDIKVMAALKGALRNQKAVIPFKVDGKGEQFLYDFFIPEQSIQEARATLAEAGIEFRTLIEQNGGTRVLIFDAEGSSFDAFADLITKNNYEFEFNNGSGEFLGSWDSREAGKEVYTRTIEGEIARLGGQGRDIRPDIPESVRIASLRSLAAEAGIALQESAEGVDPRPRTARAQIRPNAEPNPFVKGGIRGYNSRYGIAPAIEGHYAPVNEQLARDIAAAYEALPVLDEGRETQEAYAALAEEIQQQWDYAINEMGVTFEEWSQPGQPYANSREMVRDVRDNKHLWFFTGGEPHPILNQPDQNGLTMNDKLRAIHDLFGHAAEDYQFGARGEENAWIKHSQMFSPLAQKALTTETRGQNSWVNFGPQNYNEDGTKRDIPAAERPFATQKVALLPEQFMNWRAALKVDPVTEADIEQAPELAVVEALTGAPASQGEAEKILASVNVPFKEAVDRSLRNVIDKAVAEPAQAAFLKPEEFKKAAQSLAVLVNDPMAGKVKARGGRTVNLNSPDDSTARKLEKATGQRWDRRLLDARVFHALTESDRTTPSADKIASAPMVPQTLRQADFVARTELEGRPFLVFAKLYNDPDSPTGVRWHFVEAREDTGAFETQYSSTNPQGGRAMAAKVIGIGESTPKKKKTPTEAGYAQGPSGVSSSNPQDVEPDVSSGQGEVLDNTNIESVQRKILEEIENLSAKQERLAQSGDYDGAKIVGDQIDQLTAQFDKLGVTELASAPVPEQIGSPEDKAVDAIDAAARSFANKAKHLTPAERGKLRSNTRETFVRIFNDLPSEKEFAAVAIGGQAKRGWYRASSQAIIEVFGVDAPRFAALLAATSPQTSVENNLINALNIWKNWTAAGRPTDRKAILKVMGQSVMGNKGEDSVLDAWVNNSTRALTSENPEALVISGPKVNSFMLNLRGVVDEVTNDAWMANFALVDQVIFKGSLNAAGTDPGKGPGYLAMSARVRAAASYLTKLTGEEWTPAEVQETVWSWAKTLYELQERQGENRTALEILRAGELTDDAVASTPDFATLLNNGTYKQILKEAGYGEALERLAQSNTGSTGETQQRFNPEAGSAVGKTIRTLQEKSAKRLTQLYKQRQGEAARKAEAAKQTTQEEEEAVRQSAPVAPFQGNVVPGFNPSVYTPASARRTDALKRVLTDPEYQSVRAALTNKRYFAWTEKETLAKANEFIDALNGDLQDAYNKAATAYGVTPEQVVLIRGLSLKRAQSAANVARAELADPNTPVNRRVNLQFIAQHYSDMADTFAEDLMETASLAGQELRSFRLLADTLSPQSWVKSYKRAAVKHQVKKFEKDPVLKEMMARIKEARKDAAKSTTARMQKALDLAAKRFMPEGASDAEIKAHTDFARLMASNLPVRDEVIQAAVERTVIDGLETVRRSVAPQERVPEALLQLWEDRLRSIASEQINAIIEDRLKGGQVDPEAAPELSEQEKESMQEQRIMDAWREFSDYPFSEIVFNFAKATIVASDSPYAGLVRGAQFDPTRITNLRKAVKLTIDTANEIRLSVNERRASVEGLKGRLAMANPTLDERQLEKLAAAVEAVYNEEVGNATRSALDEIIRKHAEKKTAQKIDKDSEFTSRLLPLVNMGAFSDEAAYNAIAERLRLPAWNPDTAAEIEAKAKALQELPEDSVQRQEASVQLMSDILKANIKEARGMQSFSPLMQISSALWSAGILSAPPTQIVNASMTTASVFLESVMEAAGYWAAATKGGATQQQARAYFGDIARAWLFAFGKDANNTSLRAVNESFSALTKGQTKFKSEKLENMSPLEMFKFDPRVAIPGNKMMEAIISGQGKTAIKEAVKMAVGVPVTMAERVVKRDAKGAIKDYMATMKLVGRMMLAADAMNSFGAATTKEMMARRYLAQEEGMSPQEIEEVMREARQGGNEAVREDAIAQVENESARGDFGIAGSKTHDVAKARRIEQLIENQTYGTETVNAGRDFAAMSTFNHDPYGVVGWLMDTLFAGPTKILGIVTKPINPFPKTMSNLINAAINYSPYGSLRAEGWNVGTALAKIDRYPQQFLREAPERGTPEYFALHARAVAGTAAMGTIYMMVMSAVKDRREGKEPWFEVHGPGPSDPKARKQFRESGAKAFSLRIGKVVVNYTDWPGLNLALGAFGTLYDQMAYSDVEMEPSEWVTQTIRAIALTTLNRAALGGASALFEILSPSVSDDVAGYRLKQLASSYVTGFTRPSFVRWAETIATGLRQETRTDEGWLLSMAPVVSVFRGRPALNLLGEPIETSKWDATAGRVVTTQGTHPVLTPLTNAQLWINPPEAYKIYDPERANMVRDITQAEFYDYSKAYGETLRSMLTPEQAEYLAEMSKTAPNAAQETLNVFTKMAADIAKAKMAGRGLVKGKEIKGP